MRKRHFPTIALAILVIFGLSLTPPALAQSQGEIAKKLANPVASLISFPLQNNFDINYKSVGISGGFKFTLNIQPVIPIALSKDWNLISRTILPVASQNNIFEAGSTQTGLGDILQSLFLSPALPTKGGVIWGADISSGSINASVAQILPVFGQLVQVAFGPKLWYGSAEVRARWGVRLNLVLLFPKK